jgi:hypothetical protein
MVRSKLAINRPVGADSADCLNNDIYIYSSFGQLLFYYLNLYAVTHTAYGHPFLISFLLLCTVQC